MTERLLALSKRHAPLLIYVAAMGKYKLINQSGMGMTSLVDNGSNTLSNLILQ